MTSDTSWSQFQHEPIGRLAHTYYGMDSRRKYHNWQHIGRLYHHAKHTFGFPYDRNLDLAIMWHDAVYDGVYMAEQRSADLFQLVYDCIEPIQWVDPHTVVDYIMDTHLHLLIDPDDPRMILLDLADLMDPEQAKINYELIRLESKLLYQIDDVQFATSNLAFMSGLRIRMIENKQLSPTDAADWWTPIIEGIEQTLQLSHDILSKVKLSS